MSRVTVELSHDGLSPVTFSGLQATLQLVDRGRKPAVTDELGLLVAVGAAGLSVYNDGSGWLLSNASSSTLWQAASDGTTIIAAGNGGSIRAFDGASWSARTSGITSVLNAIGFGTEWVASGQATVRSTDGLTWSAATTPPTSTIRALAWNGSIWVGVGDSGGIFTSLDGDVWTGRTSGVTQSLFGVVWTGSKFVAVGGGNAASSFEPRVVESTDGTTWTADTITGSNATMQSVAHDGGTLVAVGFDSSGEIAVSVDGGATWSLVFPSGAGQLYDVIWANGAWWAVGFTPDFSTGVIFRSEDASTWILQSLPAALDVGLYGSVAL